MASTSADQGLLSIYGSIDSADGSLKIIVVNKSDSPLTSSVVITGLTPAGPVKAWRYGSANLAAIERDDLAVAGGAVTTTFAAQSITLLHVPRR